MATLTSSLSDTITLSEHVQELESGVELHEFYTNNGWLIEVHVLREQN